MSSSIKWQAVFWDFDGVILDSVNVKTEAFALMFRQYGKEIEKAVVDYHLNHGGVSRYEKFKYFYKKILNIPITEENLTKLGKEFSGMVLQKVIDSAYIQGAMETLELLHLEKVPCFVVSGTPEEEINLIIQAKSLTFYFEEIHGAPRTKFTILKDILSRKKYPPTSSLYLGDAMTDFEAARKAGVNFHGIVPDNMNSPFPEDVPTAPRVFL